ncbi:unnamed protein product, partial [Prorocentrum cordatum]
AAAGIAGLNSLLGVLASGAGLPAAAALLAEAAGGAGARPEASSYQVLLRACLRRGWWEQAVAYLDGMRAAAVSPDEPASTPASPPAPGGSAGRAPCASPQTCGRPAWSRARTSTPWRPARASRGGSGSGRWRSRARPSVAACGRAWRC